MDILLQFVRALAELPMPKLIAIAIILALVAVIRHGDKLLDARAKVRRRRRS